MEADHNSNRGKERDTDTDTERALAALREPLFSELVVFVVFVFFFN